MRTLYASAILSLTAIAQPAYANPGDTQIVWGSYNEDLSTTHAAWSNLNADGRQVVFHSESWVGGNPPGHFVFDRDIVTLTWKSGGTGTPSVSADGQTFAYRDDEYRTGIYAGGTRVDVGTGGAEADAPCGGAPQVSGNARFVAFACGATNLVRGDTNGLSDIFVRDLQAATTQRVNLGPGGVQANAASFVNAISSNGRYVVFTSAATTLVTGDTNGVSDVFLRDRRTGVTERVSLRNGGGQANGASRRGYVSSDGRYVLFTSVASNVVAGDTNGVADVFLRDRVERTTVRLSANESGVQGNRASEGYGLSWDGRYVVMISAATNLMTGDVNPGTDVFALDRSRGRFELVTVSTDGVQGRGHATHAALSRNGHVVAFTTTARLDPLDFDYLGASPDLYVHELAAAPKDGYTITPGGIDFGSRPVGSQTTRSFTLRNDGASTLILDEIRFDGGEDAYFAFPMQTDCGTSLAVGASCRISVTFAPTTAERREAVFLIGFDANSRVVARSVSGSGVLQ